MDKSTDILEMSDEDFAKLAPPAVTEAPASEPAPVTEEQQAAPAAAAPAVEAPAQTEEQQPAATEEEQQPDEQQPNQEQQPTAPVVEGEQQQQAAEEFDYKAAYENLLAKPIKANGKEIKLNSVEELVQLAQQGANYTRKMQDIAPHRKTLLMLENNGLLDADKLGFLIDLSKKDPAAVQKFLKDSGINPLDIDTEAEATYQGGNHRVSDEEAAFATTLEDMQMSDAGKYVLQSIHGTWDQASKELLVTQPNIMDIMRQQHEAGFYDRISAEVDRQRVLGAIPASQSWLQSYKIIGDKMVEQGLFADLLAKQEPAAQTPSVAAAPVATRVAAPKPTVSADARAAAAAPTRATPTPAKKLVNPLAMSDDEFMKQFENRL